VVLSPVESSAISQEAFRHLIYKPRPGFSRHCPARDYELVLPQDLLGRLDVPAQPEKKSVARQRNDPEISKTRILWDSDCSDSRQFNREGFEVVLFLQSYYLRLAQGVLGGAILGLFFTGAVARSPLWCIADCLTGRC